MKKNNSINIPSRFFVGFQSQAGDNVPLGVITPYAEDAAGLKRQSTVRSWASRYKQDKLNCVVIDNKPMCGFRISRGLRRLGWRSTNVMVRIEDPRGFELEVSIANLIMLTDDNVIQNGEIIQDCVWARDGQQNLLLPVNSQPYQDAVENTDRVSRKVSIRDVKVGNDILMLSGMAGKYMGFMYAQSSKLASNDSYLEPLQPSSKKSHFIRVENDGVVAYHGYSSMKISSITNAATFTKEEIHDLVSSDVKNETTTFTLNSGNYYNTVRFISFERMITPVEASVQEISFDDAKNRIVGSSYYSASGVVAYLEEEELWGLLSHSSFSSRYNSYMKGVNPDIMTLVPARSDFPFKNDAPRDFTPLTIQVDKDDLTYHVLTVVYETVDKQKVTLTI